MKNRSIFEFQSYKEIMKIRLVGRNQRGQLSRAAESLKCQVSFLSRVLKTEAHLTPDQSFMLSKFWKLGIDESEYFHTLVEFERAAELQYRNHLKGRLETLKKNNESLQKRTQKGDFPIAEQQATYFSSWLWTALHFLTAIPEFQNSQKIAARLGLSESMVIDSLKRLEQYGLVSSDVGGEWKYTSGQFHLPKASPFVVQYHQNWRTKAVLDAQNFLSDGLHYTSVLTLSQSDAEQIKNLLLNFISETVQISNPSQPEDALILNCDFFRL